MDFIRSCKPVFIQVGLAVIYESRVTDSTFAAGIVIVGISVAFGVLVIPVIIAGIFVLLFSVSFLHIFEEAGRVEISVKVLSFLYRSRFFMVPVIIRLFGKESASFVR